MSLTYQVALVLTVLVTLADVPAVWAFYIPGMSPQYYQMGDRVNMTVNSIRSNTELFPKDYYSLPFCKPENLVKHTENLGTLIWGDHEQSSLYVAKMLKTEKCVVLPNCNHTTNTERVKKDIQKLRRHIDVAYRGIISIDNLPAFSDEGSMKNCKQQKVQVYKYERGYALGTPKWCSGTNTTINNHLHFRISYNKNPAADKTDGDDKMTYMVVGLNVSASSRNWRNPVECEKINNATKDNSTYSGSVLTVENVIHGSPVVWTYAVEWNLVEDVFWATRWDAYFHTSAAGSQNSMHIVYICASVMLILVICAGASAILLRALHGDLSRYNREDPDELQEETGWKLIHADVFRPPDHASTLSVFVGNGYQLMGMVAVVLLLALLGFLSPSRRGALLNAVILSSVFMAVFGGYTCGTLLQYFQCKSWKDVFVCGTAFPGSVCAVYVLINIINKAHAATTAAPFTTILTIFVLWVLVSVPLTVLGASFAFRREPLSNPVRIGRLAREIPTQNFFNSPAFLLIVSPCLPLMTILMELQFVFQALWAGQVYYVFGYLAVTCVLWFMVTVLVTVIQLYYVLCYENHRWWWLAFMIPGCLGAHMFVYAMHFLVRNLSISGAASVILYMLYMSVFSFAYGLVTGAVGFTAGLMFVRSIYAQIKVD